ncbi:MAG TPA: hypothetical protein VI462_18385, partial [Acidimicrobiia bacterium]
MRRTGRWRRSLAVAAAAAAGVAGAALPAGAATPSPQAALQAAARGTWHSRFGTLQFHRDGTARFSIRECGY